MKRKFKIGDSVKITNPDNLYPDYEDWAKNVGVSKWINGYNSAKKGETGTVVKSRRHEELILGMLYLVDLGDTEVIMGEDGLRKIKKIGPKKGKPVTFILRYSSKHGNLSEVFNSKTDLNEGLELVSVNRDADWDTVRVFVASKEMSVIRTFGLRGLANK